MTFHILVVEDDADFVNELRLIVSSLPCRSEIRVAHSRDEAFEMLQNGFLDLVILDLKIPTLNGALDENPEHGHAVFNRILTSAPGTPIFVLTGSPAEAFLSDLALRHVQQIDIWSTGNKSGTVLFLKKYEVYRCLEFIAPVARAISGLSDVELSRDGITLGEDEDRILRIFSKRVQGVRCEVSGFSGGLSGAKIIRLRVTDRQGTLVHDAVAKLSTHAVVRQEGSRYDEYVARLGPAATPRKLATLEFGAHRLAGNFYGLAEGFGKSAFDIVEDPERSLSVVQCLKTVTAPWTSGVPETRRTIREVRQQVLDDQDFDEIRMRFELEWTLDFESRPIQARWGCGHGDLHGKNILVSTGGVALIDYNDVGSRPASMDPVTLELSLLFHPDAPRSVGVWPSVEDAREWGELEVYIRDSPFGGFVRECRRWALGVAAGRREVAASAYAYLMRQLKYNDTRKERVLAILRGVRSFYDAST